MTASSPRENPNTSPEAAGSAAPETKYGEKSHGETERRLVERRIWL